ALARPAHPHRAPQRVVAVLEDGRVDVDAVADGALDGVAAAVDDRLDRLDLDPGRWLRGLRKGHPGNNSQWSARPKRMNLTRASGILLHPTSLPNGILDDEAYRFVDWLAAAGQRWWQVLPLGPPEGITGSPYMSPSAFAGSPGLIADRGA